MPFCAYCGREVSELASVCPNCGHPRAVAGVPGPEAAAAQAGELAGWWRRVAAAIFDGAVVGFPSGIVMTVLSFWSGTGRPFLDRGVSCLPPAAVGRLGAGFHAATMPCGPDLSDGSAATILVGILLIVVLGILYRVLLEGGRRGQTLGKMAMSIQVRDETTREPIGYGRAFVRWLVAALLFVAFAIPGLIDVLFPLWDARHQTLHDKAARSVVVRTP